MLHAVEKGALLRACREGGRRWRCGLGSVGNGIYGREALYHGGGAGLVFGREPAFFNSQSLPARDGSVATAFRVIAPRHLALNKRHGVIVSIAATFCEYRGKCRREFLDLAEELVLTSPRSRIDGRKRRYFCLGCERHVDQLSWCRVIHVERFVHSQGRGVLRRISCRQTGNVRLNSLVFLLARQPVSGNRTTAATRNCLRDASSFALAELNLWLLDCNNLR